MICDILEATCSLIVLIILLLYKAFKWIMIVMGIAIGLWLVGIVFGLDVFSLVGGLV